MKITRNQKRLKESEYAPDGSTAMRDHTEPFLENIDVGNASNLVADTTMQIDVIPVTAMEVDRTVDGVDANKILKKKTRGRTKVKRLSSDVANRKEVEFNSSGVPVEKGSVKLSSYLGPLIREQVPFTLDDWRLLGDDLKAVLWESIQSASSAANAKCKLIHVEGMGKIVSEGTVSLADPNALVYSIPLDQMQQGFRWIL